MQDKGPSFSLIEKVRGYPSTLQRIGHGLSRPGPAPALKIIEHHLSEKLHN